jgi:hypothetical protein
MGHGSLLERMMILAMTAASTRQFPAIGFHQFDGVPDLHFNLIFPRACRVSSGNCTTLSETARREPPIYRFGRNRL